MPYCRNCGRKLEENEICNCAAESGGPIAPDIYGNNVNNIPVPPPVQGYPQQPYPQGYPQQQLQKKSKAWILAIVIPLGVLFILFLMALIVPAILGHVIRSRYSDAHSAAIRLVKAASTAIVELNEKGTDIKGTYIISSDKSKNTSVPFDVGEFYEIAQKYFNNINEHEYFVVIDEGSCTYCAVAADWRSSIGVVSYPGGGTSLVPRIYSDSGAIITADKSDNLSDLYRYTYDSIFNE